MIVTRSQTGIVAVRLWYRDLCTLVHKGNRERAYIAGLGSYQTINITVLLLLASSRSQQGIAKVNWTWELRSFCEF